MRRIHVSVSKAICKSQWQGSVGILSLWHVVAIWGADDVWLDNPTKGKTMGEFRFGKIGFIQASHIGIGQQSYPLYRRKQFHREAVDHKPRPHNGLIFLRFLCLG